MPSSRGSGERYQWNPQRPTRSRNCWRRAGATWSPRERRYVCGACGHAAICVGLSVLTVLTSFRLLLRQILLRLLLLLRVRRRNWIWMRSSRPGPSKCRRRDGRSRLRSGGRQCPKCPAPRSRCQCTSHCLRIRIRRRSSSRTRRRATALPRANPSPKKTMKKSVNPQPVLVLKARPVGTLLLSYCQRVRPLMTPLGLLRQPQLRLSAQAFRKLVLPRLQPQL